MVSNGGKLVCDLPFNLDLHSSWQILALENYSPTGSIQVVSYRRGRLYIASTLNSSFFQTFSVVKLGNLDLDIDHEIEIFITTLFFVIALTKAAPVPVSLSNTVYYSDRVLFVMFNVSSVVPVYDLINGV